MNNDLIKRQNVIESIWSIFNNTYNDASRFDAEETGLARKVLVDVQRMIESQPKIGGWIPCSTGNMPDMGSTVLIQFKSDMNGITGDDDRTFDISFIRSRDNSEWFCSTGKYPLKAVKAWKPLPDPYRDTGSMEGTDEGNI